MSDFLATLADELAARLEDPAAVHLATPGALAAYASGGADVNPPHLQLLDRHLCEVEAGRIDRLMVFMPPRHGKSSRVSWYTPPWFLARNPSKRVMLCSYEADFAASWGRKARDVIESHPELGVKVRQDSKAAHRWDLVKQSGGMATAGVGGPITGKGADLLVIDDYCKNADEANSLSWRDRAWDWYRSTAQTRLEPGGGVVIVATRWHEGDLAGRLLQDEPHRWTVINLPALAQENDTLGRAPGEALWPDRYDADTLAGIRESIGPYFWSALYQQSPAPVEGALFKRASFRFWRPGPGVYRLLAPADGGDTETVVPVNRCRRFMTVDVAASTKTSADFTVAAVWAVTPGDRHEAKLLLLDRVRLRLEGPDQVPMILRLKTTHNPSWIGVERAAYGLTLLQELRRQGVPVRELKPDADKVSRALVAVARCENGQAYFPADAPWLDEWERELLAFPVAAHDDQVDVFAYAANELAVGVVRGFGPPGGPPPNLRSVADIRAWEHIQGLNRPKKKRRRRFDDGWGL